MKQFALKGHIIYSVSKDELAILEHGYIICQDGKSKGAFRELPNEYKDLSIIDYGDRLIIPGLTDLHLHAPQYPFRALGMDLELLEWLNANTFPEEAKYKDIEYAKKAYTQFSDDIKRSATTRACMFATLHVEATKLLMDMMEETGMKCYVGKVNMDRNSPDYLCEQGMEESIAATKEWLKCCDKYKNIKPILTPRFTPSCTDELMLKLAEIQKEYSLPAQSHLSENESEIAWVQELSKESKSYGDAYDRVGMFGSSGPVIMAHCVHSDEEERALMKERGVYIAHCPASNTNLASGIAPAKLYLEEGFSIGIGSDMAGGHDLSLFGVMAHAIQVSKLRYKLLDRNRKPLTIEEVFYMGTRGGGAFFGKVGSFEKEFEFDAVILDDSDILSAKELSIKNRLEQIIYLSGAQNIHAKYVAGNLIS